AAQHPKISLKPNVKGRRERNHLDQAEVAAMVRRERQFQDSNLSRLAHARRWINRAVGEFNRLGEMHRYYDPTDKHVLDYGCGRGRLSRRLAESGALHVTGVDISELRLREAMSLASRDRVQGRVSFVLGDAHG